MVKKTLLFLSFGLVFVGCAPRAKYTLGFRYIGPVDELGTREFDGTIEGSSFASSYAMTDFERQMKTFKKLFIDDFDDKLKDSQKE